MRRAVHALALPLLAIVAAFAVGAVIVVLIGDDPVETYSLLIGSALSWPDGIGYTLFYATPLIFTGLAVALALHAGLLNIGAEGQLYVGAFAAAWVGIAFAGLSPWLLVPLAMLAAPAAGGVWGAVPGWLKARFGAHEVITTIMLNFIAVALTNWATQYYFKEPGDPIMQTGPIGEGAHIARFGDLFAGFPQRIPLNMSFLVALAVCAAAGVFLWKTRWGYALRATGANPAASEYGGISTGRQIILAMALSGALAGMVGIGEVLGYRYRFYEGFSAGYGFTGIAVALLGRRHPVGVILAALLFGALIRGGLFVDIFTEEVSKDLVLVLQAIIILFVASGSGFRFPFAKRPGVEGKA
ncbi:MAG: ABC transporter permease [Thermoanaerobaculia bacterium]